MPRTSSSPLLYPLLPRALNQLAGDETATIFQSLVARVHLDRPLARRLGWRGVRPGAAKGPAWTFRTAGAQGVYGVLFEGERPTETGLEGFFTFFFFPDEEEALRTDFSPDVRRAVARSDYENLVRDLSMNADALSDFAFGLLTLTVASDLESLALSLEARAFEEIRTETGEVYAKDRPLRMLQPGFALLVESARSVLNGPSGLVWTSEKTPALRIVRGEAEPDSGRTEFSVRETFAVGSAAAKLSGRPLSNVPLRHLPSRREERRPIVHVVSGFLGSGKTTFIASWLNFLHGRERFTGVLQNEFGEMDLDSLVLSGETKVESLDDGCVCCSLADSLRPGLLRLLASTPAEQFILETTGVASPSYVMAQLQLLDETVTPGLLITLADALDLSRHPEHLTEAGCRRDQFEAADVIVLTKADRVSKTETERLAHALSHLNPGAAVFTARFGSIPFGEIDRLFLARSDAGLPENHPALSGGELFSSFRGFSVRPQRRLDAGAQDFVSRTIPLERPLALEALESGLSDLPPEVLRVKGVIRVIAEDDTVRDAILQWAAGEWRLDPADEKTAASPERGLVLIGRAPLPRLSFEEASS